MSKINNVSDVFREAKKHLWDGDGSEWLSNDYSYICHAIENIEHTTDRLRHLAKSIIQIRLGISAEDGNDHTVSSYLSEVVGVPIDYLFANKKLVQKYRKDWLTSLEKEFAPKLKPRKGYNIHHIDGDKNNNELSNLTYVKLK